MKFPPCLLFLLAVSSAFADVRMPALFSDHAVLQRDKPLPVWGWAAPGEQVSVSLGTQKGAATAGADGRWMVRLPSQPVSKVSLTLSVAGKNKVEIKDVLLGDVWLCSGQSNMTMPLANYGKVPDMMDDVAKADFPMVRQFGVDKDFAVTPQTDVKGEWLVCNPKTAPRFTAVPFYFARKLNAETGVPIGILRSAAGGSIIECWLSLDTVLNTPALEPFAKKLRDSLALWETEKAAALKDGKKPDSPDFPEYPFGNKVRRPWCVTLHNGMIAPLAPMALRGVLWYQGETNAASVKAGELYYEKKVALIGAWRRLFEDAALPFYFVQLPNYLKTSDAPTDADRWALMRETQRRCLSVPHTGMAVTIDIGEAEDIHPKNKFDVGERLALLALANEYGKRALVVSGPLFRAMKIEGSKARLTFDSIGGGLMAAKKEGRSPAVEEKGAKLRRFAIAGADKKWVWADAVIEGDTVVASSPQVAAPVAVRYAFANNPGGANLYNRAGLPASPFRTDNW